MRYAVILILLLALASAANAGDLMYAFTYELAKPSGDTGDFIDKLSPMGGGFEIRGFNNKPFPSGLSFSSSVHFNYFTEDVSYNLPGAKALVMTDDYTETRKLSVIPVLVHSDYHFTLIKDEPPAVPYLGLAVGGYWIKTESEIGGETTDCSSWHFGLAPEGGVMIPVSPEALVIIGVRYNYAFDSEHPGQEFWTLSLGAVYNP